MNSRYAALLIAATAALALPTGASAMTARVEDGVLRVTGEPGEVNSVNIEAAANKRVRFIQEFEAEAGPGCNYGPELYCNAESAIVISLGDRDDHLWMKAGLPAPVRYSGGSGRDRVRWSGTETLPIAVDNDGQADDGPIGMDDIEADVEILHGSFEADVLGSGPRGASIDGTEGDDTVRGGSGPDRITAGYLATDGTEAGYLFAQGVDRISCGRGQDFVLHDSGDVIDDDCEAYGRPGQGVQQPYRFAGSPGDDFMGAPPGWGPAVMYAGAGDDVVQGPSGTGDVAERVELGAGNDRFRGPAHIVRAHSGNDFLDVRNGGGGNHVDCGSGRDRVIADSGDRVARNCERVTRRKWNPY